jgi:hypothetical protein
MRHDHISGSWRRTVRRTSAIVASVGAAALTLTTAGTAAQASTSATKPPLPCSATVTRRHPPDDTTVGVRVSTTRWAHIVVTADFDGKTRAKTGRADRSGQATIWYAIGRATPGYRVNVQVSVYRNGRRGTCSTWFTPRRARRHHRGGGGGSGGGGAWCSASASNANDGYPEDENVYITSNQPYTEATASSPGNTWSDETNGAGSVTILLYWTPAGDPISVTVGAASCSTTAS